MKKYLTRKEELVLLAIFRMEKEAYLVNVRQYLNSHTGKKWTVGNVYVALDRMNKLGFLNSYLGPPNAQRGGKAVHYYKLSRKGYDALLEIKRVNEVMWEGFNRLVFEE
jgi:DNA-binding PadR family transcriptional regulator